MIPNRRAPFPYAFNGFHMSSSRHGQSPRGSGHPGKCSPKVRERPGEDRDRARVAPPIALPIKTLLLLAPKFSHLILLQGLPHPLGTRGAAGCITSLGGFPRGNEFRERGVGAAPTCRGGCRRVRESSGAGGDTRHVGFKSAMKKKPQRSGSKAGGKGKKPRQRPDSSQHGHRLVITVSLHGMGKDLGFFSSIQPPIFTKLKVRAMELRKDIFLMHVGLGLKAPE